VPGPFIEVEDPHPAVEQLLGPLFSKVLLFAGPGAHVSSLRNYQCFRDKMDRLPADVLRPIGLPATPPPTDDDIATLQQILTEPIYGPYGMQHGWQLSQLGLKALIASPLTSHRALQNIIHPRAPGYALEGIALMPSTPSDLLDSLVDAALRGNHDPAVVFYLARHPNASATALATVRSLLAVNPQSSGLTPDTVLGFERAIARNKNTCKRDLFLLSRHGCPTVRTEVGSNHKTDAVDLAILSADTDEFVRSEVAENPNLPRENMAKLLSQDGGVSLRIRGVVASNPSIDKELVARLVSLCNDLVEDDGDMDALHNLAANPNVSVDECFGLEHPFHRAILAEYSEVPRTLRTLSGMEDYDWPQEWLESVHVLVAKNNSAPADVLTSLAGSTNAEVRRGVAGNAATPSEVLEQLSSDTCDYVRQRVAENKHAPVTVLESLASDDACRRTAAENISSPPCVLEYLSTDEDQEVRVSVAYNRSTPVHVLEAMLDANEDNARILICLLRNPSLSSDILSKAILRELRRPDEDERRILINFFEMTRGGVCELPVATLVALSKSSHVFVRMQMAKHPLLPAARLGRMSRDSDEQVVGNLARNPTVQMAVDRISCHLESSGVGRN